MESNKNLGFSEHFLQLFPSVKEIVVTKHFVRDDPKLNIDTIIDSQNEYSTHLHKFEGKIKDIFIFRSLKDEEHIVYAIHKEKIIFLRAFKNFKDYTQFLKNKKLIIEMVG